MTTWAELLKNRQPLPLGKNSAEMLRAMKSVRAKFPKASIVEIGPRQQWKLVSEGVDLSNPHDGHYDCWIEAERIMRVADNP